MKRILPAFGMAVGLHWALFSAGPAWLPPSESIAPRTEITRLRLVERRPVPQPPLRPVPARPLPLPPAPEPSRPKKRKQPKPAAPPTPIVKKPTVAAPKPMAAKQPAPPLQAPQAAIPDKAPEQAITAAPAEPPQPVAATATTTHRDVGPAASAQPPTDAVPADPPAAANATAAVVKAQPRYNENPPPRYPSVARRRNYQGTVVLDVFVETDGRVGDLRIAESSRYDLLDQAAMRAVTRWRFIPGRSNDQTVAMWVRVPIQFRLN